MAGTPLRESSDESIPKIHYYTANNPVTETF
jgi:hypothetical protein